MSKTATYPIKPWFLFNLSIKTLKKKPIIFYPLCVLSFIQLLVLGSLYFSQKYPLSGFFNPLISTLWSEKFLSYPYNLLLLPKLFYYAQIIIYFLIGNILLAITVGVITAINQNKTIFIKKIIRDALSNYTHLCCCSLASFFLFRLFNQCYSWIVLGGVSTETIYFSGSPYVQFLAGTFITASLAYVIPIIIIEKKKIWGALVLNFKMFFSSFWMTLIIVLIPNIFYLPILVLRNQSKSSYASNPPETTLFILLLSILVTLIIEVTIITTLTTYYLVRKKNLDLCLQKNN